MEHPGEIWQELGYNGEQIGGIEPAKAEKHDVKLFSASIVMLYRYKNGEVEYLFQHRSKLLKANPDKWDASAGGHVNLDESKVDAMVREAREEIGVELERDKLELAATYLRWKIMTNLYFYDWTGREDVFHFDDEEVEEVKWVKYSELEEFWPNIKESLTGNTVFRYYLKEWKTKILEKYGDL